MDFCVIIVCIPIWPKDYFYNKSDCAFALLQKGFKNLFWCKYLNVK